MSKRSCFVALLLIVITSGVSYFHAQSFPTPELPAGPMKDKATTACTECHESRIIVQQRLSKAAWTKEVDKMIKWGAIVDAQDRDPLIDYFSANFGLDRSAYVPDRAAIEKPHKR